MKTFTVRGEPDPFVAVPNSVLLDVRLTPHAFKVWCGLKFHMNRDTKQCNPSHATLASELGMSARTVGRAVALLEELGIVAIAANLKGGQRSNSYLLVSGWSQSPTAVDRVDTNDDRVDTESDPGLVTKSDKQEDERTKEDAREASPVDNSVVPHHYCREASEFVDGPTSGCSSCLEATA